MKRVLYTLGAGLLACLSTVAYAGEGEDGKKAAKAKAPSRWEQLQSRYDLDKDGKITWTEYQKVISGFSTLDQDGDGVISKEDAEKLPAAPGLEQFQALLKQLGGGQGLPFGQAHGGPFGGAHGGPFGAAHGGPFGGMHGFPIMGGVPFGGAHGGPFGGTPFGGMRGFPGMCGGPFGRAHGGPFGGMQGIPFMGGGNPFGAAHGGPFGAAHGGPFGAAHGNPFGGMRGFPGIGGGPFSAAQGGPDMAKLLEGLKKQAEGAKKGDATPPSPFGLGSPPQGGTPAFFGQMPKGIAVAIASRQADTNQDGTVTKAEWNAWLKTLDADEKGAVSKEKLATLLPEQARAFGSMLLPPMFDDDKDGTVEIADLEAAWKAADKDGDGSVVIKDLVPMGPMGAPFGK